MQGLRPTPLARGVSDGLNLDVFSLPKKASPSTGPGAKRQPTAPVTLLGRLQGPS